ncbi:MAG TPA: substrate-binding domain-containing protein [Burkholderiales bacterium]|nr:substrate-binding domain-containing protein [Burkholderiales bacterium]
MAYRTLRRIVFAALALFAAGSALAMKDIKMATTTSTDNSGLLQYLLPKFEVDCGCKIHYTAVGTGAALKLGQNGDVDVVLVHARPAEDAFVSAGYGVNRRDVMYNDFVIVGPASDPAGVKGMHDPLAALKKIHASGALFVSRGDDSGTNKKELAYWKELGVDPKGPHYLAVGQGMGATLTLTGEKQGYTLSDRATYATFAAKTGLRIMVEGDKKLLNPYGVIAVNPKRYPDINYQGAMTFIEWLTSPKGQKEIGDYRFKGAQLFHPDYKKS